MTYITPVPTKVNISSQRICRTRPEVTALFRDARLALALEREADPRRPRWMRGH